MKSARKMFKELGYFILFESTDSIWYQELKKDDQLNVRFNKNEKYIELWKIRFRKREDVDLTLSLLKAINKQVEELGWK